MEEIDTGLTVYDVEKTVMSQAPRMSAIDFEELVLQMSLWFSKEGNKYFMFLSNEKRDYTIFNFKQPQYNEAREELQELILSRGEPILIDFNHKYDYYELWLRDIKTKECAMYILFPCDEFIIEIGA